MWDVGTPQVVEEQLLLNAKDFANEMATLKVKLMEYEMVRGERGCMQSDTRECKPHGAHAVGPPPLECASPSRNTVSCLGLCRE